MGERAKAVSNPAEVVTSQRVGDERVPRIRHGDEDAFASVFREYANELLTFAYRGVGTRAVAEDLVQDVFLDLWARRAELDITLSLRAYLYQAVRNRVQNRYRSEGVERRYRDHVTAELAEATAPGAPSRADDQLGEADLRRALAAALQRVPPRSREVFLLNREHHLSYAEIAATLGISVKTVEVHMGRALAVLREQLGDWTR